MKKVFGVIVCLMVFLVAGCSKRSISLDKFKSIAEKEGLTVTNDDSILINDEIESHVIAKSLAGWEIEFYVFKNNSYASNTFESYKKAFALYDRRSTHDVSDKNFDRYSMTTDDLFGYLFRIDNTLLYIHTDKTYEEDILNLIDKLGYN